MGDKHTLIMAGVVQGVTLETAEATGAAVRAGVGQVVMPTVLLTVTALVAVRGLLGKVVQAILAMRLVAVLAEKQLQRAKTRITTLVMLLAPVVVMVAVAVVVVLVHLRAQVHTEALMVVFVLFGDPDGPSLQLVQEICKCTTYYSTMSWTG